MTDETVLASNTIALERIEGHRVIKTEHRIDATFAAALANLPAADPGVAGKLWAKNGAIAVSAGKAKPAAKKAVKKAPARKRGA